MNFSKIFLSIIALLLVLVLAGKQPQMLVFPLVILTYAYREALKNILNRINLTFGYIAIGWMLGLTIEIFAIWQNMPIPIGERKLFNQNPADDFLIGVGFYLAVTAALLFFVKRWNFSKLSFIAAVSFYAIVIEQLGAVFIAGFANPFLWLYVAVVYSAWTAVPYLLLYERFPERKKPRWWVYPVMMASLWAVSFLGSVAGTLLSNSVKF